MKGKRRSFANNVLFRWIVWWTRRWRCFWNQCVIRVSISFRWSAFPSFCSQISRLLAYGVRISSKASATAGSFPDCGVYHYEGSQDSIWTKCQDQALKARLLLAMYFYCKYFCVSLSVQGRALPGPQSPFARPSSRLLYLFVCLILSVIVVNHIERWWKPLK